MQQITYIIDNLLIGGAQTHLVKLTNSISEEKFSLNIICLGKTDENLAKNVKSRLYTIKMDCIWKIGFWINFLKLVSLLKKNKPHIVHTYLNTSNVFGVFAACLANIPIFISSRRDLGHFRSRLIGRLEKITGRLSNKIVCVSESVRNMVIEEEKLPLDKTVVIYNGVDENEFDSRSKRTTDNLTVSMVASMDREEKGHLYFIDAAEIVIKQRKDVRFILIGDGPLRQSLEAYVNKKSLLEYFDFRGWRKNLAEELLNTDILVAPSVSEGCSNALLEAMAMGIPAIATAVEGNLEVIENGISGILVKPKDPSLIGDKILELLNSPEQMLKIGKMARKRIIEKFTLNQMAKKYIGLYENLTAKRANQEYRVGYIVSLFPCWSEVFILNEIIEVEKRGFEIDIFSIRRDLEGFIQDKARPYIRKTTYINIPKGIIAFISWSLRRPLVIFSLLALVICKKHKRIAGLFKNLWCIFLACFFSDIALSKKFSHIHAHFATYPAFVAMAISRLTDIPFSFTAHAHDIFLEKTFLKEIARSSREIVTISEYNKRYIGEYCQNGVVSKIKVIHCGVDTSEFKPVNRERDTKEKIILGIGRLTEMKGFEYLIKACKKLEPEISYTCRIVGDGPQLNELVNLTEKLELKKRVVFEGILDNVKIKELLSKADIFALPSIWSNKDGQEGIPVVLMEAMANGVPVIASKISGIPELIEDGKTGMLVEPKNEEELSRRLSELLSDIELRRRISINARVKIEEEFNIAKTADKLAGIFKKKNALKVLFVIWSLEKGGAERFLTSLVKNLDRNKIEPVVCCLNWKGVWAQELEEKGIEVIALNKKKGIDIRAFIKLIKIIKNGKFHIVNTYLWGADTVGRLAAILANTPIIISTAENVDIWKRTGHRIIDKIMAYRTNKIIAVSEAVKEYYHKEIGIPLAKIITIPNAIELEQFDNNIGDINYLYDELGVTANDFVLVCIGRLTEQKGQKYLLKSIGLLHSEYPNLKVLFIGSGEDENKLKDMAKILNIYNMVRFLGYRKDIPQILNFSKGLVLPSLYEGLPVCVLEAMAAGKPVIATGVGGVQDLVIDGETGFIVPPQDIEALASAIRNLMKLSEQGKQIGGKGKELVTPFSIASIAKKTTDFFLSLT